jgi:pyruvate dehydrogenase E2 component (dihydrolipoamide acetyltransferase)
MALNFKFPDVGEGIHEGKLVKWLVKEGDEIKADAAMAEVETDKAVVEIPSPRAGFILKQYFKEGDVLKVGQVMVVVGDKGEAIPPLDEIKTLGVAQKVAEAMNPTKAVANNQASNPNSQQIAPTGQNATIGANIGIMATPSVRIKAKELGVDINTIKGSGPGGRILMEDVEKALKGGVKAAGGSGTQATSSGSVQIGGENYGKPAPLTTDFSQFGAIEKEKITGMRKRTSEVMSRSKRTAAHVTHFDEADVTLLSKVRDEIKIIGEKKGIKVTFLPFVLKAVVNALKAYPKFNSSFDEANDEIILKKYYNIGIAVDTPEGLVVPNIKNAEKKDLFELSAEIMGLADSAKEGKMKLDDLLGGSFTITNIGSIGGEFFTPIIYHPEVAILGLGRISNRVVVEDGKAVIAKKIPLSLSFDHRIIDGADAARFMNEIVKALENPELLK